MSNRDRRLPPSQRPGRKPPDILVTPDWRKRKPALLTHATFEDLMPYGAEMFDALKAGGAKRGWPIRSSWSCTGCPTTPGGTPWPTTPSRS